MLELESDLSTEPELSFIALTQDAIEKRACRQQLMLALAPYFTFRTLGQQDPSAPKPIHVDAHPYNGLQ